jgi:hypothetical protein
MRCAGQTPSMTVRRTAYVEERVRALLDASFELGAAHALADFLATRGDRRASDDEVRAIANRIVHGKH